jgi:hypothetical protein
VEVNVSIDSEGVIRIGPLTGTYAIQLIPIPGEELPPQPPEPPLQEETSVTWIKPAPQAQK